MTMVFDAANRITTILQGSTRTTCTYDATGNLTSENAAGSLSEAKNYFAILFEGRMLAA